LISQSRGLGDVYKRQKMAYFNLDIVCDGHKFGACLSLNEFHCHESTH
jgi:hypothetical protein